jgi:hypothetical protein
MKWLLTVTWVALHNQSIREVLQAWSLVACLVAFGHVIIFLLNFEFLIIVTFMFYSCLLFLYLLDFRIECRENLKKLERNISYLLIFLYSETLKLCIFLYILRRSSLAYV